MKPIGRDGKRMEARPSVDQLELAVEPTQDPAYGDAFQGIEFLDDAIRMEDHVTDLQDQQGAGN